MEKERNKYIENGKPKLLSEIYNKINIKLNNKIISQNKKLDKSVNEMNDCGFMFFCSFSDKLFKVIPK